MAGTYNEHTHTIETWFSDYYRRLTQPQLKLPTALKPLMRHSVPHPPSTLHRGGESWRKPRRIKPRTGADRGTPAHKVALYGRAIY